MPERPPSAVSRRCSAAGLVAGASVAENCTRRLSIQVRRSGCRRCPHATDSWRPDAPLDPRHPRPRRELAERFENYEPEAGDERPVEEYLLERAALARARSERQIVDAITAARAKNVPWQRIGELLGTSAQAAQQRYSDVIATS